ATTPNLTDSGTLTIADADAGQSSFQAGNATPVGSVLGSLSITAAGTWTYTVANSAVQYLKAGETKLESFTVKAADGTTHTVNVTITGTNDVPVISGDAIGAVTEDATTPNLTDSGTLTIADADAGQSSFQAGNATPVGSVLGSLSITAAGTWTYTVANSAVQYLKAGETKLESFTVKAADGTTHTVNVTITGTNDVPVISGDAIGAVTEDATTPNLTDSGTLTIADADAGQSSFQAGNATPVGSVLGSLSITAAGTWTYTVANSAVQYLKAGETKLESFTVKAADGTTHTVNVTITGTNDVPVISGDAIGAVTEDATTPNLTDSGTLTIADADAGQSSFQAGTATPVGSTLGSLSITAAGTWTYTVANSAVQYLKARETKMESFTVLSADGTSHTITVTITGTNDVATISGTATGNVLEAGGVANALAGSATASGTLTVSDADSGQSGFLAPASLNGTYGSFTFNSSTGAWTYTLDNSKAATQALKGGQLVHDTLTVSSSDGTASQVIDVTITGANDHASISGTATGTVTEDGNLNASGTLSVADVDSGEAVFQTPASLTGSYGSFTFNTSTGAWTYAANNGALQSLAAGQSVTDTLVVKSADGTATQNVVVTLNGANDAPTGTNNTFTIQEDGSKSFAAADFGFSDVDSSDSLKAVRIDSLPTAGSLTLGGVAVTAGQLISAAQLGSLVFTPAANANGSNYANFTFSVQDQANAFDTAPNTISISVSAVNDAPTAAGGLVSGTEDTALVFNWTNFNVADVDSSAASLGIKISSLPADGLLQYSTNGTSWQTVSAGQTLSKATIDAGWLRFVPDANESGSDALGGNGVGNQQADYARFNYVATDGSLESATATVRVDIAPVVDQPTLSLVNAASSQLISTNWDSVGNSGQSSQLVSGPALEGWTLITTDDNYAGGDNVFEVWRAGDKQVSQSGNENTVVLSSANNLNALELNNASSNAQTLGIQRAVNTVAGAVYDLSLDYAGRPGFNENFTRIAIFVDGNKIASYANTSPQNGFNWQNLHFSFVGTGGNQTIKIVTDASQFDPNGRGAMIDDIVLTQYQGVVSGNSSSGTQTAVTLKNYVGAALTDTDGSESLSLSFSGLPAGSIITTSSNPAGYVLSGGAITISGSELASAQLIMPSSYNGALAIGVTATSTELGQTASTSGTLNLQVLPGSTPPVAVNDAASTNEDTAVTINVLANDSDRNGDTLTVQTATATNGTVVINANGTITYTPNANFNGSDTITYSIGDGKGGNASATVAVTVAAVNDAPVIAAGAAVTGSEDSPYVFNWSDFKASDVDNTLTIQIRSLPSDGKLEYYNGSSWVAVSQNQSLTQADISAGKLRFVPDAHESGTDAFGGNGVGNQQADYATFTYRATDGTSTTGNATMRVDVTPQADAPKLYMGGVSSADGSALISTSPGGDGLTVRQYTALGNVSAGNMDTADEVKQLLSLLNAATPASTSVSTAPENYTAGVNGGAPTGIPTDGAYRVSGLIYLEAGKTYTFSSYQDDTALLRIGGTEVLAKEHDSWGNITASDYTPTVSGYYTIDWAVYNGSGVGAYKPYLSVNGATPKELTNGNFKLYSSLSQLDSAGGVYDPLTVGPDASGGYYPLTIRGVEDSEIKLGAVSYSLSDTDGSEVLGALLAKNLLVGTVLSDGTNSFTATAGNTSVDIKSWNLSSLKLVPPSNFSGSYNLVLEGRSTESSTGAVATSTTSMAITVANVNDAPVASADAGSVTEDSGSYVVSGNVLGNDSDVDGDTLAVQAVNGSAAAVGSVINTSYGTLRINADGSYTYTLNNDDARINALRSGETLSERINYTAKDPAGLTSNAVLTITIHGNTDQVVLWGSNGNDQIGDAYGETVVAGVDKNAFVLQLTGAALGSNPVANGQGQVVAGSAAGAQIIDAGGGNDYVEAGAGNDVIYAGDSDSSGHTFAEVKAHSLMTLADGAGNLLMSDGSGLLDQSKVSVSNPWADIVNGGSGNDALIGQGGYDLLYGGSGDDYLSGGSGSDGLRGGTGNDRLEGGSGSDVLRGDLGADTFAWSFGDQSAMAGAVNAGSGNDYGLNASIKLVSGATDLVTDFSKTEGDKLDLRDLLQGESHVGENPGNLNQYLHFEYSNNSTIVHVSSSGGFAGGVYDASKENQTIVLQNVNLLVDSNGTSLLNTNAIVQDLLKNNRLITD
ncbi:VCBS domain-containing protein, partial [Chitinimonas taiwanensis]|uniref:VCBS domain-containing protein n=1 Tax=Chitinimonas taiwanensis TaxID=240412 RepID=UPI0035AE0736